MSLTVLLLGAVIVPDRRDRSTLYRSNCKLAVSGPRLACQVLVQNLLYVFLRQKSRGEKQKKTPQFSLQEGYWASQVPALWGKALAARHGVCQGHHALQPAAESGSGEGNFRRPGGFLPGAD